MHGRGAGALKHGLGLLEAATEPFVPFAQHEEPGPVALDPVLLQAVPAFGLHVRTAAASAVVVVVRSRLQIFQQNTAAAASVRLDHGQVVAAARTEATAANVLPLAVVLHVIRVDAAGRPFSPAHRRRPGAVTARRRVQSGQRGLVNTIIVTVTSIAVVGAGGMPVVGRAIPGIEFRVPPVVPDVLVRGDAQRGYVHVEHAQVQQQHEGDER